ncbi:MAG: hypothetical protein ABSF83_09240 [Nitrososphaerales archaeon]|jgi:transcription initiation factor TFIIB
MRAGREDDDVEPEAVDRNLRPVLVELEALSRSLSLSEAVAEEAARICREGHEKGLLHRKSPAKVSASSVYAACRIKEVPNTLEDVSQASGVGKKDIAGCYRQLVNGLDLRVHVAEPSEYLPRVAASARMDAEVQASALRILERAEEAGVTSGREPIGLAASALYVAAALEGKRLTQKGAADAAGVREATIRKEYQRLRKAL